MKICLQGHWKQRDAEKAYRISKSRPKPWWHREQMQAAVDSDDWYAATFHAAWLLKANPESLLDLYDFQDAFGKLNPEEKINLPAVINDASRLAVP